MTRFAAALMIAGAALFAGAGVASASGYNGEEPTVGVDNPTPAAGASFAVTVSDCEVGTNVGFSFQGETASVTATAAGATANFTAPTAAGNYTGTATCGDVVLSFGIAVSAAPTTAPSGGVLPPTGNSGSNTAMGIAGLLLVAGVAMFGVAQVRRRQVTG